MPNESHQNLIVLKSIKMSPDDDATQVKQFVLFNIRKKWENQIQENLFSLLKDVWKHKKKVSEKEKNVLSPLKAFDYLFVVID